MSGSQESNAVNFFFGFILYMYYLLHSTLGIYLGINIFKYISQMIVE